MKLNELKQAIEGQLRREWAKSMDAEERGLEVVVQEQLEAMTVFELLERLESLDV